MNSVELKNVRLFSNHGCMEEEAKIGSEYRLDLTVEFDLIAAAISDELKDTVNYVLLNKIITEQMAIRSKLLENVAYRIIKEIRKKIVQSKNIHLKIAKINPPVGGNIEYVAIKIEDTHW